jgi:hypothetical protein
MNQPYAAPEARVEDAEAAAPSSRAHVVVGVVSALLAMPALFAAVFLSRGSSLADFLTAMTATPRPAIAILGGAAAAGMVLMLFPRLRWYWGVFLGPVVSLLAVVAVMLALVWLGLIS